ncbi:cryptochrome/photolyase family protein [Candidatus Chloroploca sp. Khr17]|uniref:cryptochrome/photolyase family protein n=1 Tax=Candidatus Chloroploca sp. Khr17 TaxID=2496869 RepID=UPI0013E9B5C5|nr:cryptochrome/photolyase family protein [Candidatus Chloroploca sp. Khr17]
MKIAMPTVWILGDQLLDPHPALVAAASVAGTSSVHVVLLESTARLNQQPYQRKKLVLLLSAMRHYVAMLRAQGYAVEYLHAPDFLSGLREHCQRTQPGHLFTMAAAEYATRQFQQTLADALGLPVTILPNAQFLVGQFDPFPDAPPTRTVMMATFYRAMRRHFAVLLEKDGAPIGQKWSFDAENRKPLPRALTPPEPLVHEPDALTQQVMEEVARRPGGIGDVTGFNLAVTHTEAAQLLATFLAERLADFGPYEDAMTMRSALLYHSGLSPYLNLGLLEPMHLIRAAEQAYHDGKAPLNSVEGFVRQVLGWREYMYWQYWRQMPALATKNAWNATRTLPAWFWTGATDLNCLHHAITRALQTGYTHHIERLMLLSNLCLLAGVQPHEVNTWFLAAYLDAYDWVMVPNVFGMGLNADGGGIATKPYIASANYINKMSDYCASCRYNAKQRTGPDACPFNLLYWNFLITHEEALRANPRLGPAVLGLNRLTAEERTVIQQEARLVLERLGFQQAAT